MRAPVYERASGSGVTAARVSGFLRDAVTLAPARRYYAMDRDSELELVRRLRAGDRDAFDAVHDEFNTRLYGFLARLSGNRGVAEDLVEETWLRLVAHADRLDPETRIGPWLFAVARNLHVSFCRARAVERSHAEAGIGLWPAATPHSPFDHTAGMEFERRVNAAMAGLPVAFREVLLLVGVEGLQPAEAAAVCGVSQEALRQRLKRARAMLQRHLEETARPGGAIEVHHVPRTTRSDP
jgi:RNA polymerase sigma-70 factor (ECF subfamily)